MATLPPTSALLLSTNKKERYMHTLRRFEAVSTRPTTLAAQEFFSKENEREGWESLPRRLQRLCQILQDWKADNSSVELFCPFSSDPNESRRLAMTASILASAPSNFLPSFQKLFLESLKGRQAQHEDEEAEGSSMETDDDFFQSLQTLEWVRRDGILTKPLEEALHATIFSRVKETIAGEFEETSMFTTIYKWKDAVIEPWLRDLVGAQVFDADAWSDRLKYCTAECFCLVRMEEIFDVVVSYPDSMGAVFEIESVLEITKMHSQLATSLRDSLTRRLNHPGANTSQIIDVYINTIKVLRNIDPSDRMLVVVAEPVRSYLRGRNDTIRCIITSLTDVEAGGDLYEELRRQDARPLENANVDSDDEEEPPDMAWKPPPPITKPKGSFLGAGAKGGDILSMLVSIYGSKELFVNEYRNMLADKLLANLDYNTDKEVHTLELLKLRFGEMSMRQCEIMIKDIDDSKRIVTNIHTTIKSKRQEANQTEPIEPVADAAIVSHIFWPTLLKEPLRHHPRLQAELDEFSYEYGKLKNPRRLIWMGQLGSVQLELDVLEDGPDGVPIVETKEFTCSPLLATLISHFEDKTHWTAEELSNETGIPEHVIQKKMTYWIHHRVIKPVHAADGTHAYELASQEHLMQQDSRGHGGIHSLMEGDEHDGVAVSVGEQEDEEMEVFESYIFGMLTNLGQLPLDRIHNMLKTFVTGSDVEYNKTPQQLSFFLQQLCKQEKLECGPDGLYKLFKK